MTPNFVDSNARSHSAFWIADGLRAGLAQFAGPTKVALIMSCNGATEVIDEQGLLLDLAKKDIESVEKMLSGDILPASLLSSNNILAVSEEFGYDSKERQYWLIKTSADVSPRQIVEDWTKEAARFLHTSLCSESHLYPATIPSSVALSDYGVHIIGSYISQIYRNQNVQVLYPQITNALQDCAKISQAVEEGTRPSGTLAFLDFSKHRAAEMFAQFDQPISLGEYKRITKVLQCVKSGGSLISDYNYIVAISRIADDKAMTVKFEHGIGIVNCLGETICKIVDGKFRCADVQNVFDLTKTYLDAAVAEECILCIQTILETARTKRHGCTVVVDLESSAQVINGERLKTPFLAGDEQIKNIVENMGKVDGAVHIDQKGQIHGFGCLLDGSMSNNEDRSRGARYNSALRFSQARAASFLFVVSSDGPLTIFKAGQAIYSDPFSRVDEYRLPERGAYLRDAAKWLEGAKKEIYQVLRG
jgi:DNA integrity scanning protein DisA with diadenylate cyclase activity